MVAVKSFLKNNPGSAVALGVLIGAIGFSKSGFLVLIPLLKPLILVGGVLFLWSFMKNKAQKALASKLQGFTQPGNVIDLCPRCGSYQKPGHRCREA